MRSTILTLAGVAIVSLSTAGDAQAAGRESILARLNSPFGTLQYSRFTVNPFGLPTLQVTSPFTIDNPSPAATAPAQPVAVEGVEQPIVSTFDFTPQSSSMVRPPFRPRVRSPFRPPPRPPF